MTTKENFKEFVKAHPILLNHVNQGKMTWQKFYEMYDMYGENSSVWDEYLSASTTFDILGFLKTLDLDNIQEGINSIQRVLGLIQDMHPTPGNQEVKKPRPIYRHFED
ncbi:MAG: hypothetical protein IJ093_02765 [Bacilli bacterium]|nr:hypothetical protein [Bacilli bacterium]